MADTYSQRNSELKRTSKARNVRFKDLHKPTNTGSNQDVNEGTNKCPEGQYYCFDEKECRPIPKGHKVREDGELVKEAKKFSDLSTQRKPGEKKKPKKKREGYIFDVSQPPSKKVKNESFSKWRKNASDAMERVAGKKKGDGDTKYKYPTGGGPYVDAGAEAADRVKKKGQVKAGILPDQIGTARKDDR